MKETLQELYSYIEENLMPLIETPLEGNIYSIHLQTERSDQMVKKQENFIKLISENSFDKVLEVGFNAGFSSLLMLMVNKGLNLHAVDLGEHAYVMPCFNRIKEDHPEISIQLGDSKKVLSELVQKGEQYDLIHIDGDHSYAGCKADIENALQLSKKGTVIVIDDINLPQCFQCYIELLQTGKVKDLTSNYDNSDRFKHAFVEVI